MRHNNCTEKKKWYSENEDVETKKKKTSADIWWKFLGDKTI